MSISKSLSISCFGGVKLQSSQAEQKKVRQSEVEETGDTNFSCKSPSRSLLKQYILGPLEGFVLRHTSELNHGDSCWSLGISKFSCKDCRANLTLHVNIWVENCSTDVITARSPTEYVGKLRTLWLCIAICRA